jgi:hypothetical protein
MTMSLATLHSSLIFFSLRTSRWAHFPRGVEICDWERVVHIRSNPSGCFSIFF